jgi:hypothetical protein
MAVVIGKLAAQIEALLIFGEVGKRAGFLLTARLDGKK